MNKIKTKEPNQTPTCDTAKRLERMKFVQELVKSINKKLKEKVISYDK